MGRLSTRDGDEGVAAVAAAAAVGAGAAAGGGGVQRAAVRFALHALTHLVSRHVPLALPARGAHHHCLSIQGNSNFRTVINK